MPGERHGPSFPAGYGEPTVPVAKEEEEHTMTNRFVPVPRLDLPSIDLDDDAIDELLDDDDDFGEGDLNDLDEPDDDYEDEL
jgi:hypothetical protein